MKNRESSQVTYLADSVSTVENKSRHTNQAAGDTMLPQDLSDSKGVICAISVIGRFQNSLRFCHHYPSPKECPTKTGDDVLASS